MPRSEADQVRAELLAEHGNSPEVQRIADQAVCFLLRAEEAHAVLVAHGGLTIVTGKGVFPHPCVGIEKNSRLAFLTTLRVLRQRPKRQKQGRPMMGEALDPAAPQRAASRFFDTSPARRRRAARYITPAV